MTTLRLPKLEDGQSWYTLYAELAPAGDAPFYGTDAAGGFLHVCLPATSPEQAEAFFVADAQDNGADVIGIDDVRAIPSVLGLPRDEAGQIDPAIAEAFGDPALGPAIVHGVLYTLSGDDA